MSLTSLMALAATGVGLSFMIFWARWLLGRAESDAALIGLTTLALSAGGLSLILLWQGILAPPIDWRVAMAVGLVVGAAGWLAFRRAAVGEVDLIPRPLLQRGEGEDKPLTTLERGWGEVLQRLSRKPPRRADEASGVGLAWLAIGVIAAICVLILFNAAYWPFSIDDAVTIYARYGKEIWQSGQLPRGTLYETYPMAVPLLYAFTHSAAGWLDQGLARLIPACLAVGSIGASFLLGRELFGGRSGLTAALLAALTPMITHWASTGYVDLSTGFFVGMCALFLARQVRLGGWRDALLAGLMGGLAAWTKNSGLIIAPSIALWLVYRVLTGHITLARALRAGAIMALGFAFAAGPWYARNLLTAGLIVPPTGWTWLAQRTLANLFPFVQDARYLPVGILFVAGLAWFVWRALASRVRDWRAALLLILYGPFFAAWWALVSYDERFLLALTPLVTAMGAEAILAAASWLVRRLPLRPAIWKASAAVVIILAALPAAAAALDFKAELLRQPLMGLDERARIALGARYDIAQQVAGLPPGTRVWLSDPLLAYHTGETQITLGGLPTQDQVADYDYVVVEPDIEAPVWLGDTAPVFESGGYRLFRVSR